MPWDSSELSSYVPANVQTAMKTFAEKNPEAVANAEKELQAVIAEGGQTGQIIGKVVGVLAKFGVPLIPF